MSRLRIKIRCNAVFALTMLGFLYCSTAEAQVTTGDKLPDVLKEIKPATGVCRRSDPILEVDGIPPVAEVPPDMGCAIPISELQFLLKRPNTAVIDLRPYADYQVFHIKDTLNLTIADLHTKPYWRDKTVVLVGSGKAERELYIECTRLKRSGYQQVRVLRGGMPQWLAARQSVIGRAPSVAQSTRLSASDFWLESQNPDNLVLLSKEHRALQDDLSFSVVLPQTTGDAIKAVLERRRKELKNVSLSSVVLATDPAVTDEQIEELQKSVMPIPLLVYVDTRDSFIRARSLQKSIWSAQARGPKLPGCGL